MRWVSGLLQAKPAAAEGATPAEGGASAGAAPKAEAGAGAGAAAQPVVKDYDEGDGAAGDEDV